jgi:hypothetical protein
MNYLPWLALNFDPPDLCLQSSEDNKSEPLAPGRASIIFKNVSNPDTRKFGNCYCKSRVVYWLDMIQLWPKDIIF